MDNFSYFYKSSVSLHCVGSAVVSGSIANCNDDDPISICMSGHVTDWKMATLVSSLKQINTLAETIPDKSRVSL